MLDDESRNERRTPNERAKSQVDPRLNRRAFLAGSGGVVAASGIAAAAPKQETKPTANRVSTAAASGSPKRLPSLKSLVSERDQRVDPRTGIRVIQITSYPLPTAPFTYDWPSITPDNQRVLLFGQRYASRDAPWDLFRCDTDGLGLCQLTRHGEVAETGGYYGCPASLLSLDGKTVYIVWDTLLCAVDVETGKIDEILNLENLAPESTFGRLLLSSTGELLIRLGGKNHGAVRVNLETGKARRIDTGGPLAGCFQSEPRLVVQRGKVEWDTVTGPNGVRTVVNSGDQQGIWSTDEEGGDARFICPWMFAHMTVLGKKSMLQGCGQRPHKCLWLAEVGKEPRKLVEGPYFWHSGASYDGDWIVADTNTPDEGLQLAHVPTAHFRTLCYAEATQDHHSFGHPHPALSPDGRVAVFRSNRTHIPQIYVAHITGEFRESVKAGTPNEKG